MVLLFNGSDENTCAGEPIGWLLLDPLYPLLAQPWTKEVLVYDTFGHRRIHFYFAPIRKWLGFIIHVIPILVLGGGYGGE